MDLRTKEERLLEEVEVSKTSLVSPEKCWNFVVMNENDTPESLQELVTLIFNEKEVNDGLIKFRRNVNMLDLLDEMKLFPSKRDIKNKWKSSDKEIEDGCSAFLVGKKRIPLFIWKSIQIDMVE